MFTLKSKLLPTIVLAIAISVLVLLPEVYTWVAFISSTIAVIGYYVFSNYDIDYKYWFSFVSQLLGLIFFVITFLMVFTLGANLISQ